MSPQPATMNARLLWGVPAFRCSDQARASTVIADVAIIICTVALHPLCNCALLSLQQWSQRFSPQVRCRFLLDIFNFKDFVAAATAPPVPSPRRRLPADAGKGAAVSCDVSVHPTMTKSTLSSPNIMPCAHCHVTQWVLICCSVDPTLTCGQLLQHKGATSSGRVESP